LKPTLNSNHFAVNSTDPETKCKTPSEEFYENHVLQLTSGIEHFGSVNWFVLLALFIAWVIVALVLLKGVQSLGKVSYFTAIFPYLMLTILLIRGATLPGAAEGVKFYLTPRVEPSGRLQSLDGGGHTDLLQLVLLQRRPHSHEFRDAVMVALINCGTSVFAGLVIFCNLGFMSHQKNVPVGEVAKGGPGLAFIVYPEALTPHAAVAAVVCAVLHHDGHARLRSQCSAPARRAQSQGPDRASKSHSILLRLGVCACLFALGIPMTFRRRQFAEDIKLMVGGNAEYLLAKPTGCFTPLVI
uniref:SLC38A9 n=1 Tax=Macrostomum lignano TaxID=282301 RepID=A0A1I8FEC9_9PLAT